MTALATRVRPVEVVRDGSSTARHDAVAVEEPLEIRLTLGPHGGRGRPIAVTMRTPGHDEDLAVGFLHGEGILRSPGDLHAVRSCGSAGNVVQVVLREGLGVDAARVERNFYTSSSCGLCGKASIEAALSAVPLTRVPAGRWRIGPHALVGLPQRMREAQATFAVTGGLHAAALFSPDGALRLLREDVGRHNALDKVIGASFRAGELPLRESIVVLSGRASFELLQKAMAAQVPLVAAIGAPSSLAVELAEAAGITLVGFLRSGTFNVYAHGERLRGHRRPERAAAPQRVSA